MLGQSAGTRQPSPGLTRVFRQLFSEGWFLRRCSSFDSNPVVSTCPSPGLCVSAWPATHRTDGPFPPLLAVLSAFPFVSAPMPLDLQGSLASRWRAWPHRPCLPRDCLPHCRPAHRRAAGGVRPGKAVSRVGASLCARLFPSCPGGPSLSLRDLPCCSRHTCLPVNVYKAFRCLHSCQLFLRDVEL